MSPHQLSSDKAHIPEPEQNGTYPCYAPPEHDRGTVHPDKAAAEADEHH